MIWNEGFMSTEMVQYVLKGANYIDLGYEWSGKISVLGQILSTDWLQNQIRVIGGAYGGFSSFGASGNMFFGSYRDPNLAETLENYDATTSFLEGFEADETAMTRYIIGTIATLDNPETPAIRGNTAMTRYYNGITREYIQSQRDDILSTTADDIREMSQMVDDLMKENIYCVYGNSDKIEQEKNLFMSVMNLRFSNWVRFSMVAMVVTFSSHCTATAGVSTAVSPLSVIGSSAGVSQPPQATNANASTNIRINK